MERQDILKRRYCACKAARSTEAPSTAEVQALGEELQALVAHPDLYRTDETTLAVCRRWGRFCHRFFHTYQDLAMPAVLKGAPPKRR